MSGAARQLLRPAAAEDTPVEAAHQRRGGGQAEGRAARAQVCEPEGRVHALPQDPPNQEAHPRDLTGLREGRWDCVETIVFRSVCVDS